MRERRGVRLVDRAKAVYVVAAKGLVRGQRAKKKAVRE